jgi:hypothetical protein
MSHYWVLSVYYAFTCRCLIAAPYILTRDSRTLLRYPTSERRFSAQIQSYIATDGQSASPSWCQASIWDPQPILPLLPLIIFRQIRVCWCGRPLWREVASVVLCFFKSITSAAFLRSESHGTPEHILLSLFLRLPQPGGPGPRIYIPQEQGSPVIPQGIGFRKVVTDP